MRSVPILLLAGALVAFAGSARAGAFGPPVSGLACGLADIADLAMEDPTTAYVSAATPQMCQKLCERAAKRCRVYVNDAYACRKRIYADVLSFGKANCDTTELDPADAKACKQSLGEDIRTLLDIVEIDRGFWLADCTEWRDACRAACTP